MCGRLLAFLVLCLILVAGVACEGGASNGSSAPGGEAEREVSSTQDAVDAAVDWVRAEITVARTELEDEPSTDSGVGAGLFVYTYSDGGDTGRMESVEALREPLLPFPLVWRGDTYYLETESFRVNGVTSLGVSAGPDDVQAGSDSPLEDWRRTAGYLGMAFAALRMQDPLRLLQSFSPNDAELPTEKDGQVTIGGTADRDDLVGVDAYREALADILRTEAAEGSPPVEEMMPAQVELTLTLSTDDWRPLELRIGDATGPDERPVLVRWERGTEAVTIPEDYTPLLDYVRPAADAGGLLETAEAWFGKGPTRIEYAGGRALVDGELFQVDDLPGEGVWGGAFFDDSEAGVLLTDGERYYWRSPAAPDDWTSADRLELHQANEAYSSVLPEEQDQEKAVLVYRAILRGLLLEVLDPRAWVERMRERLSTADNTGDPIASGMAVSETEEGYEIRAEFREEEFLSGLDGFVPLTVRIGNPPPPIAERDTGDRPWNYTMMFAPVLLTDREGRPLSLTLKTNATSGFAELQSLTMTFERTEEHLSLPADSRRLSEVLE